MSLRVVPVDLKHAREFVAAHHRHNEPPVGHKFITYTQADESGASLRAAGFRVVAQRPPRPGWDTPSRPRTNKADRTPRTLWDAVQPDGAS